jgi:hypothetical protein
MTTRRVTAHDVSVGRCGLIGVLLSWSIVDAKSFASEREGRETDGAAIIARIRRSRW